jgi:DNA-binding NarL/FixJ family response regulator
MMQLYTKSKSTKEYYKELENSIDIIDSLEKINDNSKVIIYDYSYDSNIENIEKLLSTKLVFTIEAEPNFENCKKLLQLGVKGYSNSFIPAKYLSDAIEIIKDGNIWIHPPFMQRIILNLKSSDKKDETLAKLTDREKDIALLVADSLSNKDIATKLNITDRTVKAHLSSIFEKLEIKDRLSLALLLK